MKTKEEIEQKLADMEKRVIQLDRQADTKGMTLEAERAAGWANALKWVLGE